MGFLEEIAETARRALTGDDWYVTEQPYVLELRSNVLGLGLPQVYMVFPLGPQNYTVSRVFRQGVTPTMGGLIAEEQGLLWREVTIQGTFGLRAKTGEDTSILPEAAPGGAVTLLTSGLSGPGWTRRMVRNFFEKYAELKANPDYAAETMMIWHDVKTDDHWVVVPEVVDLERTVERRMQYPFMIRFRAIAESENILLSSATSPLSGLGKVSNAVSNVSSALDLVQSAIQEGSAILGEVRYFVAQLDSVLDDIDRIADAAADFKDGVTDTLAVGRSFVQSVIGDTQTMLDDMETAEADGLPTAVRQNYQMAADGLDAICAQISAFGTSYQSEASRISTSEQGPRESDTELEAAEDAGPPTSASAMASSTVRSTDKTLKDAGVFERGRNFANYRGFRDYAIQSTDSLFSIAAKFLKDGSLWYDLAIINGLKTPYISSTGAPNTVGVGDVISIPLLNGDAETAVVGGEGAEPGEDLLGTDIALTEKTVMAGRPLVDLAIDRRTYKDVAVISGVDNLAQALQMRVWTEQGTMPLIPAYGLARAIGLKNTSAQAALLRTSLRSTLKSDSRVRQVSSLRFEITDDVVEFDVDVVPIGSSTARTISTSIV